MRKTVAKAYAIEFMTEWGLIADGWKFRFNKRKSAFGMCDYRHKSIELSAPLTEGEADEDRVINTILHEIAHALVGPGKGHGPEWKAMAVKVGAEPKSSNRMGVGSTRPKPKYVMILKGTGEILNEYHRSPPKSRLAKLPNMYIPGRKAETLGKLRVISAVEYERYYGEIELEIAA